MYDIHWILFAGMKRQNNTHFRELWTKDATGSDIFRVSVQRKVQNNYYLGEQMTIIDEILIRFRGRCSFVQYIPNKPAKYDLKVCLLCDSKTLMLPILKYTVFNSLKDLTKHLIHLNTYNLNYLLYDSILETKKAKLDL